MVISRRFSSREEVLTFTTLSLLQEMLRNHRWDFDLLKSFLSTNKAYVKACLFRMYHLSPFVLIYIRCRRCAISCTGTNSQQARLCRRKGIKFFKDHPFLISVLKIDVPFNDGLNGWFYRPALLWRFYSTRCPNRLHTTLFIRDRVSYWSYTTFCEVFFLDPVHTFIFGLIQIWIFFREYVSVFKAKQEPSLSHALLVANTNLSSLPQEFRHLHRALGEHLEQYWKDSQIESKIFISAYLFFHLCSPYWFFLFWMFCPLEITINIDLWQLQI